MAQRIGVLSDAGCSVADGAIIITTNTTYKQWPRVFNNDATITTAILDRLLHHCETVTIEGKSYRMKDKA